MEAIHLYGSDSSMRMFFIEYNLEHPEEFTCCISVPPAKEGRTCGASAGAESSRHLLSRLLRITPGCP